MKCVCITLLRAEGSQPMGERVLDSFIFFSAQSPFYKIPRTAGIKPTTRFGHLLAYIAALPKHKSIKLGRDYFID